MPTIEADTVSHVENSMKAYLKGGSQSSGLTETITSSVKKALLENVEFTPAVKPASLQVENLRTKYISLNPSGAVPGTLSNGNNHNAAENNSNGIGGKKICQDEMPEPKVVLYPPQKVQLHWTGSRRIGPGIQNMGNTCFMNSVLQCLTYTAPFANFILSGEHKTKCRQVGFCAFCEIGNHITRALTGHENVIRPMVILRNLRFIAKDMSWGKQEDSHEFLRLVLDHIQKSGYKGIPNLDSLSKETTVVNQIFGGFLRSQVLCLKCKYRSSIYEPFLDLSLDIKNVTHIQKALERFVHPDHLEGKNAYKCTNCKNSVQAQKRFTIHRAPNVLTLQLKRFQFGASIFSGSGKMTKHVAFPTKLELKPYMSVPKGDPVLYNLFAVICHSGYSCNSGHYFAYVCAPNKAWYVMNDSQVNQVQLGRVMSAEAYMLFYLKATPSHLTTAKQAKIGPQLPMGAAASNTDKSLGNKGQFTPIVQKRPVSSTQPNENSSPLAQASKILPANQRERVSFGIKLPNQQQQSTSEMTKPRIVMHIKSGKVVSISPTKAERAAGKTEVTSPSKLVPYGDESDSDEDVGAPVNVNGKKNGDVHNQGNEKREKLGISPEVKKSVEEGVKKSPTAGLQKSKEIHTDRVLNTPPKKHGTLRRSLSADGPLTVNTNTQYKLNATPGQWTVTDNGVAQSPSLASECSNSSVNSTTEWNVMDSKEAPKTPVIPEAQCPGWTVTPTKEKSAIAMKSGVGAPKPGNANTQEKHGNANKEESSTAVKRKIMEDEKKSNDGPVRDKPIKELTNSGVDKKHNVSSEIEKQESISSVSNIDGKEIKEYNTEKNIWKDSKENEVKAKSVNVNGHGNEREKLFKHGDEDIDETAHKRKKCGMEKEREDEHLEVSDSYSDERRKKKKKKKKHKKHKHEDKEPLLQSSDSDSGRDTAKQHSKKKRKYSRDDDEEESSQFVWVEKTKESLQDNFGSKKENYSNGNGRHVETKVWDSKASYKDRKHTNGVNGGDKKDRSSYVFDRQRTWDGSKSSSSVVNELRGSSIFAFGDKVQSWDGGRSAIDQEVERDKMIERKRRMEDLDTYEEDLDCGRVKKVKRRSDDFSHRPQGNPFQKYQDGDHYGRDRWHSGPSGRDYNDRHSYSKDSYRNSGYDRSRHQSYHGGGDHRDGGYKSHNKYQRNY